MTFSDFSSGRHRRGWLDISGIFSKVFGFGRQKDIYQMQSAVAHLETLFKNHALATQNMFKDMHSALDLTNKSLGLLSSRLQILSNFTSEFATHMVNNLAFALQFPSTCFKDIFDLYRELENVSIEFRNLESGLASLIQGHLSPHLIIFD